EVVVPCAQFDPAKTDHYKNLLHEKKCPLWRMKASLKLQDYDALLREKGKYIVGLGALGPEAVPGFIADLKKPDLPTRLKAVVELGQIGSEAKQAVPDLLVLLQERDDELRGAALTALGNMGTDAKAALPAFRAALKDRNPALRRSAARGLGQLGP